MNKELKDITITVCATQDTVESDSFNNTYDANATYPVVNVTELKEALSNGGVVAVTEDIQTNNIEDTAAARIVISQPTTLNLEKKIITPDNMGNNNTNFCALIVDADTTINAGENGGIDTGAIGHNGSKEKHVVLAIAKNVRAILRAHGIDAKLTRSNDTFIPLYDRVEIAHKHGADLFMSIHADGFTSPSAAGASVFALSNLSLIHI